MNLYQHDCSYLFTEYGKRKSQECYDIEAREKEKAINDLSACNAQADGEQEGNEYKNVAGCPRSMDEVFDLYHPTVQGHREYRAKVKISSMNGQWPDFHFERKPGFDPNPDERHAIIKKGKE